MRGGSTVRAGAPERSVRPGRVVLVVGTGTEVGKTWVSARVLAGLRAAGVTVAARKPAQSFDPGDDPAGYDSAILGAATGEPATSVCPPHRAYERPMAPPMAAASLGRDRFSVADLVGELAWPAGGTEVGLVESAGGVRSPQADDGDAVALARALRPDVVLLVADAGLGTINSVRLSVGAMGGGPGGGPGPHPPPAPVVVVLNRFDPRNELHRRNRDWLVERDGLTLVTLPGEESTLAQLVRLDTPT
jgi:dethiobiotin synthetase